MAKTYQCENPACSLGAVGQPGLFTGGATKEQVTLLTGDPTRRTTELGVCPNCGKPGKETMSNGHGSDLPPHRTTPGQGDQGD